MKRIIITILFFLVVFGVSFSVWYSPVLFKGYAPYKISEQITLAKNIHNTGVYSVENSKSVYLASSLIEEQGRISGTGNKFTAHLYSWLFKVTGVLDPDNLVLFSILLNSLTLLIFTFIVYRMFGLGASALFSAFYILLPYNWYQLYSVGVYGFAVFFSSLFFLFFLLGWKRPKEALYLFSAGTFLALAALSREAFFLLIPIFFIYLWFAKKRKLILPALIPVVLIIAVFYVPSFWGAERENVYSNLFFSREGKNSGFSDFGSYAHLYPDAYVYHFEKENFLSDYNEQMNQIGFFGSLQAKKVLANLGERRTGILERIMLGSILLPRHLSKFVSFEFVGGPFVFALALLGLFYMKKKNNDFYKFSLYWILGTLFLLSYVVLVSRSHLMDFNWLIPLLASLGVLFLGKIFADKFDFSSAEKFLFIFAVAAAFAYNLLLADHFLFGKVYDSNKQLRLGAYAERVEQSKISDKDVISLGLDSKGQAMLNYLADKSTVVIAPNTIKKLIEEDKLENAFEFFNVKYILGYNDNLSLEILSQTEVSNIASSSIKINPPQTSPFKSLFMNMVR